MLKMLLVATTTSGLLGVTVSVLQWLMVLYTVYFVFLMVASFFKRKPPTNAEGYNPKVSVLIPAHDEQEVIAAVVHSVMDQDYKNLELIVIDDASSDRTPEILRGLKAIYPQLKVLRRELYHERGKPAALNDALLMTTGEIITVFDADTVLDKDYISRVIPYLADQSIVGIQTKVRMYSRNFNFWTAVQDSEFALHCSMIQAGRDVIHGFCGLGGCGQFVRKSVLAETNGWKPGMLADDFDLSLNLMQRGYRIGYADVPVYVEPVTKLKALFKQRNRWSQGCFQSTLQQFKSFLTSKNVPFFTKLDTLYSFTTPIQPVILVLAYAYTVYSLITNGWHFNFAQLDSFSIALFGLYFLFIVVGHFKGKAEDWKTFLYLIPAFYVYSLFWCWMYSYSIIQYMVKKGNITWAKTEHTGTTTGA